MPLQKRAAGSQRYCCQSSSCLAQTFMLNYRYKASQAEIKEQLVDMAINGSGIRDTERVLKIIKGTAN